MMDKQKEIGENWQNLETHISRINSIKKEIDELYQELEEATKSLAKASYYLAN
jgi:hypothetical protein